MDVDGLAAEAEKVLGDRLVALYRFGSGFARGPRARDARLLALVSTIDVALLRDLRPLARQARDANLALRVDTARDVLRGADVFPVFSLELLETRQLIKGTDVLGELAVHPPHLRIRIEQSLRALHRELLSAYLAASDDRGLAVELRGGVRKAVYLLRGLALVCALDVPAGATVEALTDAVIGRLLPDADRAIWHRLRRVASFEEPPPPDELVELYGGALAAFAALIEAVDGLDEA